MIYIILGIVLGIQIICLKMLVKRKAEEKKYYPSVNFSIEDPRIGHIVAWNIGDIWFNYESLTCFMLTNEGKRHWKVIGSTSIKYTKAERKAMKECNTEGWDFDVLKEQRDESG